MESKSSSSLSVSSECVLVLLSAFLPASAIVLVLIFLRLPSLFLPRFMCCSNWDMDKGDLYLFVANFPGCASST